MIAPRDIAQSVIAPPGIAQAARAAFVARACEIAREASGELFVPPDLSDISAPPSIAHEVALKAGAAFAARAKQIEQETKA